MIALNTILPVPEERRQMSTRVGNCDALTEWRPAICLIPAAFDYERPRFGNITHVIGIGPVLAIVGRMKQTKLREGI